MGGFVYRVSMKVIITAPIKYEVNNDHNDYIMGLKQS